MGDNKRIPKRMVFPFGYIIKIVQLNTQELAIALGDPEPPAAAWIGEERTIYLDKTRPIKNRRADLIHELGHAFVDWQAWMLDTPLAEAKG